MKHRHFWIIALCLTPVVCVLRTWQLFAAIDEAGFYKTTYETLCAVLGAAFLAVLAIVIAAARLGLAHTQAPGAEKKQSLWQGLAALALALCCIPQAAIDFTAAANPTAALTGLIPSLILAVSFAVLAALRLGGKPVPFFITVLPVLSEFARLVMRYATFNGVSHVSESVIQILFMCSFLAFLLAHSRFYAGVAPLRGIAWAFGTGAATAVLGVCATLPHLVAGQNQHTLPFVGVGAAIYALTFMGVLARPVAKTAEPEAQPVPADLPSMQEPVAPAPPEEADEPEEVPPLFELVEQAKQAQARPEAETPQTPPAKPAPAADEASRVFDAILRDLEQNDA